MGDLRLGILGVSHGHPYSMGAFFNGYDRELLRAAYPNIEAYLEAAPPDLRRIPGARVEWVWAANPDTAKHVAQVCRIPNVAAHPQDLAGRVDAVLVTEGAGDSHLELSAPFVKLGLPLFIDKPLAGSWADIRDIWRRTGPEYPILCCSNLRYNPALPEFRERAEAIGEPVLLRGLTAMDWTGYGWHLAEVLVALWGRRAAGVRALGGPSGIGLVEWRDGAGNVHTVERGDWTVEVRYPDRRRALLQVSYPMGRILAVSVHGTEGHLDLPIHDWFTMMRSLLLDLVSMFRSGRPPGGIMEDTLEVGRIITGAVLSRERGGAAVALEELALIEDESGPDRCP